MTRPGLIKLPAHASALLIGCLIAAQHAVAQHAVAQESGSMPSDPGGRQSLDDAWWTGPMLAPGAGTLPAGHMLVEPYLYDATTAHAHGYGSLTYINYGLADRLTVGMIPTGGYNQVGNGASSSQIEAGDLSLQAQYRLSLFEPGGWVPTTSVVLMETLPTGRFDRLGNRPSDGLGSGVYSTTLGFYAQSYFWMPNGRVLRMRIDLTQQFSQPASIDDVSVYGTQQGFRGHADPGNNSGVDIAWEYSVTREWVLGLDLVYHQTGNTHVAGTVPQSNAPLSEVTLNSGAIGSFAFAPAVEYNLSPTLGFLFGTRVIPSQHNVTSSVTPAVAVNLVL